MLAALQLSAIAGPVPGALVRRVTHDVLSVVRQDDELRAGNPQRAMELVEEKVAPHFNFVRMTALAVGRDWRDADAAQREALTDEFRTLLVRTYSNALTAYENQTIDFMPVRMMPGKTYVTVRTRVRQPGARPLSIDYDLEMGKDGWKVYDVVVGGASLITSYRTSFANEIRVGGIDGLIKALRARNHANEDATASDG